MFSHFSHYDHSYFIKVIRNIGMILWSITQMQCTPNCVKSGNKEDGILVASNICMMTYPFEVTRRNWIGWLTDRDFKSSRYELLTKNGCTWWLYGFPICFVLSAGYLPMFSFAFNPFISLKLHLIEPPPAARHSTDMGRGSTPDLYLSLISNVSWRIALLTSPSPIYIWLWAKAIQIEANTFSKIRFYIYISQ